MIISNSVLQQNPEKIKVDYHVRHTALCKSLYLQTSLRLQIYFFNINFTSRFTVYVYNYVYATPCDLFHSFGNQVLISLFFVYSIDNCQILIFFLLSLQNCAQNEWVFTLHRPPLSVKVEWCNKMN